MADETPPPPPPPSEPQGQGCFHCGTTTGGCIDPNRHGMM